jgi:hypothetical protein
VARTVGCVRSLKSCLYVFVPCGESRLLIEVAPHVLPFPSPHLTLLPRPLFFPPRARSTNVPPCNCW